MIKGFLNLPWFVWAALAFVVALIYTFVWPEKAVRVATGFRFFVLCWGHALVWVLIAIGFVMGGMSPSLIRVANSIALTAGVLYVLFLMTAFVLKQQ